MDNLYNFIYRGILTDASLDKVGRKRINMFGKEEEFILMKSLSFEVLDSDYLNIAKRMSIVYIALHSFENMVRYLVKTALTEKYKEKWWENVPEKIRKKSKSRQEEDLKFRWHGSRGLEDIDYCDFGDLSSIIITNWALFENVLTDMEWAKGVLSTLERSRNIIMHGGVIEKEDINRIGMNIRDWINQTG